MTAAPKTIQFYDIDYAALDGRKSVLQPIEIGELTPHGEDLRAQNTNHYELFDLLGKILRRSRRNLSVALKKRDAKFPSVVVPIFAELIKYELKNFSALNDADEIFGSMRFLPASEQARTPSWHRDNYGSLNQMYIIGSDNERFNTEYAVLSVPLPARLAQAVRAKRETYPLPSNRVQQEITDFIDIYGRRERVGRNKVMLMPQRTLHRSSPDYAEIEDPYAFMRLQIRRQSIRKGPR